MRRIVTAITAAALAFSMVSLAMPANAAGGFDSAYAGESAFLTLNPGQAGTFTVFFANTGTNSWTKGTATQVDLAACLEDKVTCNQQDASEAPFNPGGATGWLSSTRYATTTQTAIAPGAIGTFTYNVSVPNTATGLHRFNGALVVSTTGADVHNEGYYQDVNIPGQQASCTPATITTTPTNAQETVGATHTQTATVLCSDGKPSSNAAVTVAIAAPVGSLNANLTLTGTTDTTGKTSVTWTRANPDTDTVELYPTAQPNIRATATIFWVVKPVIACTPTTSGTTLNGQSRIFTLTLRDPKTGDIITTPTVISVGVNPAVSKGTASINGTVVDTATNANNTENKQLLTVTTDANGNATLTVSGTNSTVTAVVWLEQASFGGNADTTLDTAEFQATCGTTAFQAVNAVALTITPTTAATVARSGQRIYTISAADSAGNPTAAKVNIGFAENLLATTGTNARVIWFDIDTAAADQRGSQASGSSYSRQSVCNRVPGGTWNASTPAPAVGNASTNDTNGNAMIRDASGGTTGTPSTKRDEVLGTWTSGNFGSVTGFTTGYPRILGNVNLPSTGRMTFAICDETASDTATPLVWQDLNASPDFNPETGEPSAQGGTTTWAKPVLTTGIVFDNISGGGTETVPATGSAGDATPSTAANTAAGFGLVQWTFRMRNQSRIAFFPDLATGQTAGSSIGQTVIWTIQNTGSSNVFLVNYDSTPAAAVVPQTVSPGQSIQVQTPIYASGTDCTPGGRDQGGVSVSSGGGSAEYGQTDCFSSANVVINAGAATTASVTATLVSNGAMTGTATTTWVAAVAEPVSPANVGFTASGTVVEVNTNGWNGSVTAAICAPNCYYLLQTASGTFYKIDFGGTGLGGIVHASDTYIYLGTQFAGAATCMGITPCSPAGTLTPLAQFIGVLSTGNKLTFSNQNTSGTTGPTAGNAVHNITATQ